MAIFYGLILTLLYFSQALRSKNDIFSPRFIFNVYAWIKNVPYFLQIGDNYDDIVIFKYFIFKVIGMLMVNAGITFYERHRSMSIQYVYSDRILEEGNYKRLYYVAILLFIIGASIRIYIVMQSGGLFYVLSHLQSRGTLLAGYGYINTFSDKFLNISVILCEFYYFTNKERHGKYTLFFLTISTIALLFVFGARKPVLMFLVRMAICYHYVYQAIDLRDFFRPKSIVAFVSVVLFMIMVPMLRYKDTAKIFMNPLEWVSMAVDNINSIFREFSYLTGDMYVFEKFNINNYWLGAVYKNIIYQWIPSSIMPDKPPMDDGMYLYNMMKGIEVVPGMATKAMLHQTSVPFTMEGALYINFGILGIVIFSFLIGMFYQYVFKVFQDTKCCVYMIIVYQTIIFEFVPSVLHITSPLISIIVTSIVLFPLLGIKIKRYRRLY